MVITSSHDCHPHTCSLLDKLHVHIGATITVHSIPVALAKRLSSNSSLNLIAVVNTFDPLERPPRNHSNFTKVSHIKFQFLSIPTSACSTFQGHRKRKEGVLTSKESLLAIEEKMHTNAQAHTAHPVGQS